jgi:F0F1-type ATP synthase assembly protein I
MNQNDLSQLSDKELLEQAKIDKPSPIIDAFLIGILIGIITYSFVASTWGLVTLVPVLIIYALLKKPKKYEPIKKELRKRNLK